MTDDDWPQTLANLEAEPCSTCGAEAGQHCVVVGTTRRANFPHAPRYNALGHKRARAWLLSAAFGDREGMGES